METKTQKMLCDTEPTVETNLPWGYSEGILSVELAHEGRARRSRDVVMESCTCRCHWCVGPLGVSLEGEVSPEGEGVWHYICHMIISGDRVMASRDGGGVLDLCSVSASTCWHSRLHLCFYGQVKVLSDVERESVRNNQISKSLQFTLET